MILKNLFLISIVLIFINMAACAEFPSKSEKNELAISLIATLAVLEGDDRLYYKLDNSNQNELNDEILSSTLYKLNLIKGYAKYADINLTDNEKIKFKYINSLCLASYFALNYKPIHKNELLDPLLHDLEPLHQEWISILQKENSKLIPYNCLNKDKLQKGLKL
jgi:hypothetical protein